MKAFIDEPRGSALWLKAGIWLAEKITGRVMLPARILAWAPRVALGAGLLESLAPHPAGGLNERLLKFVRMKASFAAACPFCIDMNSHQYEEHGITRAEWLSLQSGGDPESVASFTERERTAIAYAGLISQTPLQFPPDFVERLLGAFDEREIVTLAGTAAQVNYWARMIQALGIPPAGFTDECKVNR